MTQPNDVTMELCKIKQKDN